MKATDSELGKNMHEIGPRWLDTILFENAKFQARVDSDKLPAQRMPGTVAVITCMDSRVNLEAIGIPQASAAGEITSPIRIIRTIGAMPESRSLVVGIFLAGIREIAIVMHTDCGCCLAYSKIDTIVSNLENNLTEVQLLTFRESIGKPFRENLRKWLRAFEDPREALKREIAEIKSLPFMPQQVAIHGLLYELASGNIDLVVNGYGTNLPTS